MTITDDARAMIANDTPKDIESFKVLLVYDQAEGEQQQHRPFQLLVPAFISTTVDLIGNKLLGTQIDIEAIRTLRFNLRIDCFS
jgi:primosomal replication protein N